MKLVILDRDGTINALCDEIIRAPEEWVPLPGALEAIARLNHAGFHVVIAMNHSGLGRGLYDMATFNAVHSHMHRLLAAAGARIDAVFYCPHTADDGCDCRKPLPGLLTQIGARFGVALDEVALVGDNARDMQTAEAAGCAPHLVLTGESATLAPALPLPPEFPPHTRVHASLAACADFLIAQEANSQALPATS